MSRFLLSSQRICGGIIREKAARLERDVSWGSAISAITVLIVGAVKVFFDFTLDPSLIEGNYGAVWVSRHRSYWDGVIIGAISERSYPVTSATWRRPFPLGWFLEGFGVIWADGGAVDNSVRVLKRGGVVWFAPRGFEGPRRKAGLNVKRGTGAVFAAQRARVPVVVVGIQYCRGSMFRRSRVVIWSERVFDIGGTAPEGITLALDQSLDAI